MSTPSAEIPEWSRENAKNGRSGYYLIRSIRRYQYWVGRLGIIGALIRRYYRVQHRLWSLIAGASIPLNTELGGGLMIPHPNGIVIHPSCTIGPNCMIFQQVTLGVGRLPGVPQVGGHVDIGAGAKLLGGIVVGDHARIGANAVVLQNVPAGALAVGVPARIIRQSLEQIK